MAEKGTRELQIMVSITNSLEYFENKQNKNVRPKLKPVN